MEFEQTQSDFLRKMTPGQKLEAAMSLYYSAKELKRAWLRQNHTEWSDERIEEAVREAFFSPES